MKKEAAPVVVTTKHKGVFFGYYDGDPTANIVTITNARLCVYWSEDVRGFMGLAATGPTKSCRIGPAVPKITLQKVTSIIECSPDAIKAWESSPWRR